MTEVAEPTMSYEGLVAAGRAAREQADNMQWVEGDLALQVEALPGDERPRDPETGAFLADEKKALKRYADDVGVRFSVLKEYRRTAEAWPSTTRVVEAPWGVHHALAAQEDRFDLIRPGMTVRQAEAVVRYRRAATSGRPGWFELVGRVGDALRAAEKHMTKAEDAITREPTAALAEKALQYAERADRVAERLRKLAA